MDAMVQAGWRVGRTWGFSLGDGTGQSALGETVLDPSATLEPAPGGDSGPRGVWLTLCCRVHAAPVQGHTCCQAVAALACSAGWPGC